MTSATFTGRLEYLGWNRPWFIVEGKSVHDLSVDFWSFAEEHRGKGVTHAYDRDSYTLVASDASEFDLEYLERGGGIIASKRAGFGMFSVIAYLEWALLALNGRPVIATIDERGFKISRDPAEDVPAVVYKPSGNMGVITPGMARAICKMGQGPECCIFLCGGAEGLECGKFDAVLARQIVERKAKGLMNADRIGDCRLIGREGSQ